MSATHRWTRAYAPGRPTAVGSGRSARSAHRLDRLLTASEARSSSGRGAPQRRAEREQHGREQGGVRTEGIGVDGVHPRARGEADRPRPSGARRCGPSWSLHPCAGRD